MIDDLKTFTAIAVVPASDADGLTPDDIAANAADADAIRAETTNIANSRWVIARRLREVKKRLGHGKFLRWLDHEKLGWCARKARIDMQIVRAFESESDSDLTLIGPAALKALSAPTVPPEVRAEALQVTKEAAKKSGRKGAASTARASVAKHKKTAPAPELAKAEPKGKSPSKPRSPKPQASTLEPKPPVSRMIDSLEIDRLISPKVERIKARAKRVDQSQISMDIILLADNIQVQIAKWTEGSAGSPNS
jgi:Protein of unknown function (DUF3102)